MQINIGIAGAGNFAMFAANIFMNIENVTVVAIIDKNAELVNNLSKKWNVRGYIQYDEFLDDNDVDLVYIATPPFLHYQQSKLALLKGKHVICEKPAALHASEAEELANLADSLDLLWVVNLMQRYNSLYHSVSVIIREKILGEFLHGYVENYASDENLNADHWFWDESKSGGIFIEHGVHFFDMFTGWLGKGKVLNATELNRPGSKNITDRVQATVLYENSIVNFYHGFDQPKMLDRLEIKLLFEKGDITLYEWIPVKMRLHALLSDDDLDKLIKITGVLTVVNETDHNSKHHVSGRSKDIFFHKLYTLEHGNISDKLPRYEELLKLMITDQISWIRNSKHDRIIDSRNAIDSLITAEDSKRLAKNNFV